MAVVVVDVVVVLPGSVLPDPVTAINNNITVSAGTTTYRLPSQRKSSVIG